MNARACLLMLAVGTASVAFATPSGNRWSLAACGTGCAMGTQCVAGICVPQFRQAASVDNSGSPAINGGVTYSTVPAKVNAAFAAWTSGRVGCNTNWNSVPVAAFSTPTDVEAINGMDRFNNIIWLSNTNWTHMANELALTTTTYYTLTHEIFDADMEVNNNVVWSTTAAPATYDVDSVIIHEAGHFLGLNHTQSSTLPVMYPLVSQGVAKRVLTTIDETDVCTVYPGGTGGQGVTCTGAGDCTTGSRVCEGVAGGSAKICTQDCSGAGATCPAGFTCQASTAGFACLPQVGVSDQCKFCQGASECSSGVCLRFDTGVTFCSLSCSESAQCGPNYTCQLPDGFCVPNANTCTNQCTTATECASGYTCVGGTCTPRGDTGDTCTVSLVCKGCNVCTRESATATNLFCRACCAGQGLGGNCNACPNTACGSGNVCVALTTGSSSVCLPGSAAPTTCAACNGTTCAEGLQCVFGRCRSPCNPASPGTCQACFSIGANGSCACADELSSEGEPCGQLSATTLAACGSGLSCVGASTAVCRARCELGNPASCPTGKVCQQMNSIPVCVPGTDGNICAPCTNTGGCNAGGTCYLGRCYEPCNTNLSNTCATCVQAQSNGTGVCGCQDQISAENEPCGTQPDVHSCKTGMRCLNGLCRARCDPSIVTCPVLTDCADIGNGSFYCVDQMMSSGGGGGGSTGGGSGGGRTGGGGGSSSGGGTGGGGATDLGCGCGASGGPLGALVFGVLVLTRRRRTQR